MTRPKAFLLLDIGGTFIKESAAFAREGKFIADFSEMVPMNSAGSLEEILSAISQAVSTGCKFFDSHDLTLAGVGVSIPGPFDYAAGISRMVHKFQAILNFNLGSYLRSLVAPGVPVVFVHDVTGLLAGELSLGAARGFSRAAVVTLGTGIGFSHSIDGVVQVNELGSPATSIFRLPCGEGILEDYVSKRGFLRAWTAVGGSADDTVKDIADKALAGDALACGVFAQVASILAENIRPILQANSIECLLFGGQISKSLSLMLPTLKQGLSDLPALKKISTVHFMTQGAVVGCIPLLQNSL